MNEPGLQLSIENLKARFQDFKRSMRTLPAPQAKVAQEASELCAGVFELLQNSERKLSLASAFIDIAGVILLALDDQGTIVSINVEGARVLGYASNQELVGKNWFSACLPAELAQSTRHVFDLLISGQADRVEFHDNMVVTSIGTRRHVHWHNSAWLDEAGRIIGTISSGRDVTDERRALLESQARLEAVVKTAVDSIITIDQLGIMESVNPATELMFGYRASELIGKNVSLLMPTPYRQEHDDYLARFIDTGKKHIIGIGREVVGRHKSGSVFPIDLAVSEFNVGGRRMFTGVIRNITERKKLEHLVLEISTEEQQRIGRDLHDSLGQELTGIAFLAEVLQKSLASQQHARAADAAEIVSLVNQAIDHTRALVRGLCPVNLEDEGLMNALSQLAESVKDLHGVRCEFICPMRVLIADHHTATHLYYITNEAVTNALRHGKPRRIIITLKAAGDRGLLTVADDGAGISDKKKTGHGRGILIMHYRARMIGGSCDITSKPGQETTVSCNFKLARPEKIRKTNDPTQSPASIRPQR